MKKIVLVDGNNLMFRSYFATAYNGNTMKNSKGFPTNALYGFITMINKIIAEENPSYMAVAFDIGKNFRKQKYDFYKDGRAKTPDDLKVQMPIARDILKAMGIKYLEKEPYEADDIIGSLVKMCEKDEDFEGTIISSDKDLLQLINYETDIKLLKQSGFIRYNEESFEKDYGIKPIKVTDLKGLMGDSSDNIPGVKGIGEKTALKLLHDYESLEGIYENIDNIKGSIHDKLTSDKDKAFMSKEIATIYKDVPLDITLEELKYEPKVSLELRNLYEELEFYSLLKNLNSLEEKELKYIKVDANINVVLDKKVALYIEADNEVYTKAKPIAAAIKDENYIYYFNQDNLYKLPEILKDKEIITYDHKKNLYLFDLKDAKEDLMVAFYLLNYNVKDDLAPLAVKYNYNILEHSNILKSNDESILINNIIKKVDFIYSVCDEVKKMLEDEELLSLYENIEMPLIRVLSDMEKTGIVCKKDILKNQGRVIEDKIDEISEKIYEQAGYEFNIASTRQLGELLFDKLELAKGRKTLRGYKTDVNTLEKLRDKHPVIDLVLEYRNLSKLRSTYIYGLENCINEHGEIHTIFKQTITRTGRLSSAEPNLQNIPVRDELGKEIRKSFVPKNDVFLSCDYSQIELRVLAHVAKSPSMIETFKNNEDIHTKVASDINGVDIKDVTPLMRSKAKAVIFGIVYGISGYGLSDNLLISKKEADYFINKYYDMYPEIKKHMNTEINFAKENGFVKTIFGRKRIIEEIKSPNYMVRQMGERMAINTPIQGSAADIIKMAMIKVYDEFQNQHLESKLILQVHDELIFDVKKEELSIVEGIVKNVMENITDLLVPLKVSTDVGENWYETK